MEDKDRLLDCFCCEHYICQIYSKPMEQHWKAVKHILQYIVDTTGFSGAKWVGDIDDHKSTSGYLFKVGDGSVS